MPPLPGVPVTDTIRHRDGGPVDRDELVAVQTPQAFAADRLRAVHAAEPEATDDASLVEAAGGPVVVVPGEPENREDHLARRPRGRRRRSWRPGRERPHRPGL